MPFKGKTIIVSTRCLICSLYHFMFLYYLYAPSYIFIHCRFQHMHYHHTLITLLYRLTHRLIRGLSKVLTEIYIVLVKPNQSLAAANGW